FGLRTGAAPLRDDHAGTRDSPLAATAYSGTARRGNVLPVQHLGDEEGELQGLRAVQPRIADGLIALIQVILDDRIAAADALGDVVAGELDVNAARVGAERAMHLEEAADLLEHIVEATRFVTAGGVEGVAVHGITDPRDHDAASGHFFYQRGQHIPDVGGT